MLKILLQLAFVAAVGFFWARDLHLHHLQKKKRRDNLRP